MLLCMDLFCARTDLGSRGTQGTPVRLSTTSGLHCTHIHDSVEIRPMGQGSPGLSPGPPPALPRLPMTGAPLLRNPVAGPTTGPDPGGQMQGHQGANSSCLSFFDPALIFELAGFRARDGC